MRRWFQFSLRTLFVLTTLVAIAVWWWLRPFVREEHWPDGKLKAQYRVRYDWRGNVAAYGEQVEFHDNGQRCRRWYKWSGEPGGKCEGHCQHWDYGGTPLDWELEHRFEELIDLITNTIRPESWSEGYFTTPSDLSETTLKKGRSILFRTDAARLTLR